MNLFERMEKWVSEGKVVVFHFQGKNKFVNLKVDDKYHHAHSIEELNERFNSYDVFEEIKKMPLPPGVV